MSVIITQMFKLFFSFGKPDQDTSPYDVILQKLQPYENEITSRGTEFFGAACADSLLNTMYVQQT
ncbi:hypothetical protein B566_EDAN006972 [Ephemera danica]|nr:hypothetical protein B566_EDAN006972 [Ephemera danica]